MESDAVHRNLLYVNKAVEKLENTFGISISNIKMALATLKNDESKKDQLIKSLEQTLENKSENIKKYEELNSKFKMEIIELNKALEKYKEVNSQLMEDKENLQSNHSDHLGTIAMHQRKIRIAKRAVNAWKEKVKPSFDSNMLRMLYEENRRLKEELVAYEEAAKKAFLRSANTLNSEALNVFQNASLRRLYFESKWRGSNVSLSSESCSSERASSEKEQPDDSDFPLKEQPDDSDFPLKEQPDDSNFPLNAMTSSKENFLGDEREEAVYVSEDISKNKDGVRMKKDRQVQTDYERTDELEEDDGRVVYMHDVLSESVRKDYERAEEWESGRRHKEYMRPDEREKNNERMHENHVTQEDEHRKVQEAYMRVQEGKGYIRRKGPAESEDEGEEGISSGGGAVESSRERAESPNMDDKDRQMRMNPDVGRSDGAPKTILKSTRSTRHKAYLTDFIPDSLRRETRQLMQQLQQNRKPDLADGRNLCHSNPHIHICHCASDGTKPPPCHYCTARQNFNFSKLPLGQSPQKTSRHVNMSIVYGKKDVGSNIFSPSGHRAVIEKHGTK